MPLSDARSQYLYEAANRADNEVARAWLHLEQAMIDPRNGLSRTLAAEDLCRMLGLQVEVGRCHMDGRPPDPSWAPLVERLLGRVAPTEEAPKPVAAPKKPA